MNTILRKSRAAMSLVEIIIVVVILGVVLGAVLMLLTRGTTEYHFSRRQNELDIAGRQALNAMANSIIWAGYMPGGGWGDDDWHPVVEADTSYFEFYADYEADQSLDSTDYRGVQLLNTGHVEIVDGYGDRVLLAGESISKLEFTYLDESGGILGSYLSTEALRDQVRHIQIRIELTAEYGGDVYQTYMQTTISPRNLGLDHDINPNFFYDPEKGHIVFNIADTDSVASPTAHEDAMIYRLSYWGYTLTMLMDHQLETWDYTDVNLLVLRHMPTGQVHPNPTFYRNLNVPIITMNGMEAAQTFLMGSSFGTMSATDMDIIEPGHEVHDHLSTPFTMYEQPSGHSYLEMDPVAYPEVFFLTQIGGTTDIAGLCVLNDTSHTTRRILYSPWEAIEYTESGGWVFFRNVIDWGVYWPDSLPGTPMTELEDFEGPEPATISMNIFDDPMNPALEWDTTAIWREDFQALKDDGVWEFAPGGSEGRCEVIADGTEKFLRMDRDPYGAGLRNIAVWTTDMTGYDAYTDNIILRMDTQKGWWEGAPDSMDGVFFRNVGYTEDTLYTFDFEGMRAHGDIEFWGDLYGQYAIHSPAGWSGDGDFVTFDTRVSGQNARNRLMLEVATTGFSSGADVTVDYRFHDHMDESHTTSDSADFVGWNASGRIDDAFTLVEYLDPGAYNDFEWHDRSVTFTPSVLPDPLYILFGQYGNQTASSFALDDGISLDNIRVSIAGNDSSYSKICDPSLGSGWEHVVADLDAAAVANGVSFGSDFELVFSQYGFGYWEGYGRAWDNIEICTVDQVLTIPGWEHGSLVASQGWTGVDDWSVEDIASGADYCWGLRDTFGDRYSDSTYCYLESPLMTIPSAANSVELTFRHSYMTGGAEEGGWVQISIDGTTWTDVSLLPYDGAAGTLHPSPGTMIFYGSSGGWRTETVDLAAYAGQSIQIRFVFGADMDYTGGDWQIDDVTLVAEVDAWEITSIEFEATTYSGPSWNWTFRDVDIWMGASSDSSFTGGGEWDKSTMTLVKADYSFSVFSPDWWTISLDTPFLLPDGLNLQIKIEKEDTLISDPNYNRWGCVYTPDYQCRRVSDNLADPTYLNANNYLPVLLLNTTTGQIGISGSTDNRSDQPMNSFYYYSDFEGIYTPTNLGLVGNLDWTHGGNNDDWQFGEPLFVPNIDPALTSFNGNTIAGTDLAMDGYYYNDEFSWLISPAYVFPDTLPSEVTLRIDRCVRMAPGDEGLVFVGFSDDTNPPTAPTEWMLIRSYPENQSSWDTEDIDMTTEFIDGGAFNPNYYFLRFVLVSNLTNARGGWNLDNIQVFGD